MFREIRHFIRNGSEINKMQQLYPRAEFADRMASRVDGEGYAAIRRELVGDLTGRVLEIGCGTGTMFQYYGPEAAVEGIEPEEDFLALAVQKAASMPKIAVQRGNGMELAFPDGSFDAVVFGLVLCSVPSVPQVLAEAHRVLRSGGQLRALEHVRSEALLPGLLLDMANPLWRKLNRQGCNWNRNPIAPIEAAGFQLDEVRSFQRFDTAMPAFPMRRVRAHKA